MDGFKYTEVNGAYVVACQLLIDIGNVVEVADHTMHLWKLLII